MRDARYLLFLVFNAFVGKFRVARYLLFLVFSVFVGILWVARYLLLILFCVCIVKLRECEVFVSASTSL